MKVAIAADHAGVVLKDSLKLYLESENIKVADLGTNGADSVDYPDYARKVAHAVASGEVDRGVLVCGSAIGMAITANRNKGVRAAVIRDAYDAQMSREHNDANVACFGARVTPAEQAKELLKQWLTTPFEGGRHQKRIDKIDI
ncbi:MAG: ribose 5-phosphate isomerase B [Deltaproteobacteria bacterium CG11_big_fil_rev_8_21_14_0_20_47_16]|nr:MAG: ribose 5-phosphate isomerase B [Deltaproteobacteria bacterium CG11_big_fil_rev_8_21_14_0_20_47_16]